VGEINAEFLDPENNADRKQDLLNTTRDGFLEDSPIVKKFEEWAQEFLRKVIQGVETTETTKRTDALLKQPAIRERRSNACARSSKRYECRACVGSEA